MLTGVTDLELLPSVTGMGPSFGACEYGTSS